MKKENIFIIGTFVLPILLFNTSCVGTLGSQSESEQPEKIDFATITAPKNGTFADHYAVAVKFGDAFEEGRNLLDQGADRQAIGKFEEALTYAGSRAQKAMAYSKLALCYEKLGDVENQIKYLELDSKATLSKSDRSRTLQKISELKSRSSTS